MALPLLGAAAILATLIVAGTLGVAWLVGLIARSLRSLYVSRYRIAPAFPVQLLGDGEGMYRVEGVLRATEEEVVWRIDARTRANAIAKAELRGAVVTQVVKLAPVAATEPAESIESSNHHPVTIV